MSEPQPDDLLSLAEDVAAGGTVVLEVQERLVRLARQLPGVVEAVKAGDPLPEFALHCPLLSLPPWPLLRFPWKRHKQKLHFPPLRPSRPPLRRNWLAPRRPSLRVR